MQKLTHIVLFIGLVVLTFPSCKTKEKLVYFQNSISSDSSQQSNYTPSFKTDDLISIIVTADNPEIALTFNLTKSTSQTLNNGYTSGNIERIGYLINSDGNISMPIIGEINLKNLNRLQASKLIQEKIKPYVANPIVNIQILNYKVSVLGDVKRPGTFKIPNERITILEAIGLSGDLNITGNRKNVLIIRDNDGVKEEFRIDLTNSEVFSSPAYYLQQNDVVYIEPNNTARSQSTLWRTSGGIFISLTALIVTTINVITK